MWREKQEEAPPQEAVIPEQAQQVPTLVEAQVVIAGLLQVLQIQVLQAEKVIRVHHREGGQEVGSLEK